MKRLIFVSCLACLSLACNHKGTSSAADRHYHLAGEVKALDAKQHTAQVDAAAIPNYMDAMTMDYPVKSEAEFGKLKVGERIEGTLNVHQDDTYDLSDIREAGAKP